MLDSEAYTLVTRSSHHQNYDDYVDANSGKAYDLNVYLQAALRRQYPELALTVTNTRNGKSHHLAPLLLGRLAHLLCSCSESPRICLCRARDCHP